MSRRHFNNNTNKLCNTDSTNKTIGEVPIIDVDPDADITDEALLAEYEQETLQED